MKDCNQLFVRGIDYLKTAVLNWDARRSKITRAYVASNDFATIRHRKDRCFMLILALEKRVDDVFFAYRRYVAGQKELEAMLSDIGVQVEK